MPHYVPPLKTQKMTKTDPYEPKMAKNALRKSSPILDPKSKNNCTLFSSIFQSFAPFSRYGRLKSSDILIVFIVSVQLKKKNWINQDQKYTEPNSSGW